MKTTSDSTMSSRRSMLVLAGICLIALAVFLGWLSPRQPAGPGASGLPPEPPRLSRPEAPAGTHATAMTDKSATAQPADARVAPLTLQIQKIAAELRRVAEDRTLNPEQRQAAARALLAELRNALRSSEPDAATAAILEYLNSGADITTGLGFTLEAGGILADAPSVRTALLDLLGQFDPIAAAAYAEHIFDASQIPDEWALALRNLGWQNQNGSHTEQMRARFQEMLDRNDWAGVPSEGFLQAFDTAVHLGGVAELNSMIGLVLPVDGQNRPVQNGLTHGAYLALDRLTVQNPVQTLETLTRDPELLAWAPEHRASLIARADVSQPNQRALVEAYLATLANRPLELETFTNLFPNRNGSLGNNLITTPPPANGPSVRDLDAGALRVVDEWLRNGTYPALDANLRRISGRLTEFLGGHE